MHPRPQPTPPFVGRDAELGVLTRVLETVAVERRPDVVVLEGPSGIGKSRLAQALAAAAGDRGYRAGTGRGWPDGEGPDLWPWGAIARDLGVSGAAFDAAAGSGRVAQFVAVIDRLRGLAAPLLVVLDDAHAADAASLRLAAVLARQPDLPLLLVLVGRAGVAGAVGAGPWADELTSVALVIDLPGLPPDAAASYVAALSGGRADAALAEAAYAVTRGNPLHLRSLIHRGIAAGSLHGGLERAVRDLLAGLPAADRRHVAIAALLGSDASIQEVARTGGSAAGEAALAVARAAALGLLEGDGDRVRFVHDSVRREAVATVPLAERLALHERAAAAIGGASPEAAARRAHHAVEAARGSAAAAARAVDILREAAGVLRAAHDVDAAAALLRRAAGLHASARPDAPAASLAIEHAEAVLASGRLAASRPLFHEAARAAEREGDTVSLARAALGLGGVWVSEHRLAADVEALLALLRRARDRLPAHEAVLRARLAMRLAAEEAYRGGTTGPVLAALEDVRRTGNAGAVAEALSLAHHALLTPDHTLTRLAMAHELVATAVDAADDLLAVVGLCWRAADLFELGHARAPAALEELRLRAEAGGVRSLLFIARAMGVMLAIRAGDFARAEAEADACVALGREVGDADALAYHGAHLAAIRYFQGREAELTGLAAAIADSATLIEQRERAFASAAALFACRAGRPEAGRALLDRVAHDGIGSIPPSSSWLITLGCVAELAHVLDDAGVAHLAYGTLLRHAHLPVIGSLAVVCFGSAHRPLALAALACGNLDLAVDHFRAAIAANDALGHRPAATVCRAELALAQLRRGRGDDDTAGRALLRAAIDEGDRFGMGGLTARWRDAAPPAPTAGESLVEAAMSRLDGGRWRVAIDGDVATVDDRVGLRYLATLVAAPGRAIPALALVADGAPASVDMRDPVMDERAIAAVRDRIAALRRIPDPSDDVSDELTALTREFARASGLGGRLRAFADSPERARTAARKAIKRAIDDLEAANPAVGRHLRARVETGTLCCYHRAPIGGGAARFTLN